MTGGRNAFEYLLALLAVGQKNGFTGRPQTQAKIERSHETLQRWLAARPAARTTAELQPQLDEFREHYNEHRPHRLAAPTRHPESDPRHQRACPRSLPPAL